MNRTEENLNLLRLAKEGDKTAEDKLIRANTALVKSIALRYLGRGEELDDLMQLGFLGMLKAIRGFDTSYGTAFSTYAVPLINGEIRRFLRDDGLIKVSREAKRNYALLMRAKERFTAEQGKEPHIEELANITGISKEDALYALESCSPCVSLQEKTGDDDGLSFEDLCTDTQIHDITEKIALKQAIDSLDSRQKTIVYMRFFKGLTQNEAAKRLGLTQVKISRAEKKIKEEIRRKLAG